MRLPHDTVPFPTLVLPMKPAEGGSKTHCTVSHIPFRSISISLAQPELPAGQALSRLVKESKALDLVLEKLVGKLEVRFSSVHPIMLSARLTTRGHWGFAYQVLS